MYQTFFKLTGKPFRLSPDPSFFFPSRGHKRALAYLRYGLSQDEGFVVITGSPGTGKTTLAKILLQEMSDSNLVVAHLTTTQLDPDDMLRMVAASFGLRYEGLGKTALIKALESFLLARAREKKRALLVIDEAQNLPQQSLEELRMLSNLQVGDKALVQTFLLGQAQFRHMLDNPDLEQLRQRVIANYHLSPLASDECQRYIESRLEIVGWDNDPHFAEIAYELIHEYTEGIPRRINMLCDRVLLYACMEDTHEITGEVIQLVLKELEQEISGTPIKAANSAISTQDVVVDESDVSSIVSASQVAAKAATTAVNSARPANDVISESSVAVATKPRPAKKTKSKKESKSKKSAISAKELPKESEEKLPKSNPKGLDIVGNTIKQKQFLDLDTKRPQPGHSEISDRDLFRVIPGGKPNQRKPDSPSAAGEENPLAPAAQIQPSAEDVVQRRILRLVLAYHRSPSRFPGLDKASQALPEGITELLELAVADDQILNRVSPAAVMGISPVMLRAAVRFFIRRALFVLNGDDYRVLGLAPNASQALVEKHYDLLMRLLRQDKQRGSADSVTRVGQAYESLSRLDQARQSSGTFSPEAAVEKVVEKEEKIKSTEYDDLTIDFDIVDKKEISTPRSPFVGKPDEVFAPQRNYILKRVRYAGQLAVLGFGALVIILGLYIVQMGPSDQDTEKLQTAKMDNRKERPAEFQSAPQVEVTAERQRGLQFSDGASRVTTKEIGAIALLKNKGILASNSLSIGERSASDEQRLSKQLEEIAKLEASIDKLQNATIENAKKIKENNSKLDTVAVFANPNQSLDSSKFAKSKKAKSIFTDQRRDRLAKQSSKPLSKPKVSQAEILDSLRAINLQPKKAIAKAKPEPKPSPSNRVIKTLANKTPQRVVPRRYAGRDIEFVETTPQPKITALTSDTLLPLRVVKRSPKIIVKRSPQITEDQKRRLTTIGNIESAPVGAAPTVVAQAKPRSKKKLASPGTGLISTADLGGLLDNFASAYAAGDTESIMDVFSTDARTNSQASAAGIRKDYVDLFGSTAERKMKFNKIQWEREQTYARGVGTYNATISAKGSDVSNIYSGDITLQIQKRGGELKVTRFYFTNQTKKTKTIKQKAKPKPAIPGKPRMANAVELQAFVSNFLSKYKKGEINSFMAMFANNAKSSDQSTKAGIRKDHEDLFKNTQSRSMTINNFIWANETGRSNGVGDFVVNVKGKNSDQASVVKGKMRLIVTKTSEGLRITHMLHTLQ